jgi:hypothetical protein
MLGFDPLEFVVKLVILRVTDDRRIMHVIEVEVKVQFLFEFFVTGFCAHIPIIVEARIGVSGISPPSETYNLAR